VTFALRARGCPAAGYAKASYTKASYTKASYTKASPGLMPVRRSFSEVGHATRA